jgi:pimeloyl-ACP methyl ester carboxylesterase
MATRSGILKVPGARLYCEVQGSGPVLLIFPGGPTDVGIFAGLAGFLANLTVASYDPRGNSRSNLEGPPEYQQMDVHGDDAAHARIRKRDNHTVAISASTLRTSSGSSNTLSGLSRCRTSATNS